MQVSRDFHCHISLIMPSSRNIRIAILITGTSKDAKMRICGVQGRHQIQCSGVDVGVYGGYNGNETALCSDFDSGACKPRLTTGTCVHLGKNRLRLLGALFKALPTLRGSSGSASRSRGPRWQKDFGQRGHVLHPLESFVRSWKGEFSNLRSKLV